MGIVIFRMQELFAYIIVGLLKKDLTFTTRTRIWDASMLYFTRKPLLGYGVEPNTLIRSKIWGDHAHNQYLWDLYRGGILHFSCFVAIIAMVTAKLMQYRADRAAQILAIVVCIILLMWQVEAFNSMMFFAVYVFAYHIDKIIEGREAFLGKDEAAQQA